MNNMKFYFLIFKLKIKGVYNTQELNLAFFFIGLMSKVFANGPRDQGSIPV